jgi:hypothetical protein
MPDTGISELARQYMQQRDEALAELDAARARVAAVTDAYRKVPLTVRATCGDELADALEALGPKADR